MTKSRFRASLALIAFCSLVLRNAVPVNPLYNAYHDDLLMVNLARSIMDGNWLGDYSILKSVTLAKPPGYSLFLANTHWLPWSPVMTVHLVLIIGALLIVNELRIFEFSRRFSLLWFGFFVFYPTWFNEPMSRIYREGFLTALATLLIGLTLILRRVLIQNVNSYNKKKPEYRPIFSMVGIFACMGILLSLIIVTKPSWHSSVVFSLIVLISAVVEIHGSVFRRVVIVMASVGVVLLFVIPVPLSIMSKNNSTYGVRLLDNFSSGNFPKALNLLYGIEDTENRQYVDLTLKMRNQAYEVSPTFAKLRPFLELPENKFWKQFPCLDSALSICDESANWFPWELREAIDRSGLAPSPKLFEELNGGIYEELATACFTKRIVCQSPGLAPSLDSLDSIPRYSIVDAMSLGFSNLLSTNLGQTDRTNGAKIEVDANVSQTWNQTIKGLPTNTARLRYESNDAILGDTRYLLSKLYSSIFVPLVLLAIFGVIKNLRRRANLGMLALSVASWVSVTVLVLQLSLLEASSGTYMRLGAENYLLPSIPFLLVFIGVGVQFMFDFFQQKADRPESGLETKQI